MRLVKVVTLLLALLAVVPAPTRAADCGDGPGDADFDGVCDAFDPCEDGGWNQGLREARVTFRKLGARPNDDTLRFRAIMWLGAEDVIDPAATGLRLTVLDGGGTADDLVLDVAAPGGSDWVLNNAGRSWSYRSSDLGTSAIKRPTVKEIEPNPAWAAFPDAPRALLVTIAARRGTYGTTWTSTSTTSRWRSPTAAPRRSAPRCTSSPGST
jgi:hypothetical protein